MTITEHRRTTSGDIDPITFEVIRHKLQAITEEQGITLKQVSGSPVVTDATDFNNGIYLADGSIVTMGPQVLFHTGTMSTVIRSIVARYSDKPGINEGDMYLLNDPYYGAVHQPDMSLVAPVFFEGRHVAWAGACAHQLDVGGMNFGSWAIGATEIQQEAMLLPGIKLVEGGEVREDLWQMLMGMSRMPHTLGLDLRAMIAANNVAARRLGELYDRYGYETVVATMSEEIDSSERLLRERLARLPDGTFRSRDYLEHDGHENRLYEVCMAVHKRGDTLEFDLTGTSAQAPGFINCTRSGLIGAVFTGLLPILAPDIRWNEGLMRPVTVVAPEGIVVNATRPAPVSAGTISAVWVAQNAAVAALSRLAAVAAETMREGQAVTKGSMMVLTLAGVNRDGGPFGTFLLDSTAGGGGAFVDHDGLDGSGDYVVPRPAVANVESNEAHGPYLYLFRSFVQDSGGPGRQRGGVGTGLAITPHGTDGLHAMMLGHGVEVPNSIGLFGGMEGSCGVNLRARPDGGEAPVEIHDLNSLFIDGAERVGPKPGAMAVSAGSVIAYTFQGGGGYGDPIRRNPAAVGSDVAAGLVSVGAAARQYGVVAAADGAVDGEATARRRIEIRTERIGRQPSVLPVDPDTGATAEHPDLRFTGGRVRCCCGADLGSVTANWKDAAITRVVLPSSHGPHVVLHAELELREHICGACGTLLDSEVARIGEPSLHAIELAV
jgi:N-methylhydantoinase B